MNREELKMMNLLEDTRSAFEEEIKAKEAPILLEPPQEVLDDPDFRKTSKTIVKQVVGLQVSLVVKEYHAGWKILLT